MNELKTTILAGIRWGWFGLLVLLAFGYLVAGLSGSNEPEPLEVDPATADVIAKETQSLDQAVWDVDQRWADMLAEQGMKPAEIADWMTICRRMSLALVGNGLSLEEIRTLERLPLSEREAAHLESLLSDPRFHDYWGERWTRFLVGTDGGQFIVYRRRRFRVWLTDQFAANLPYDQMVQKLITAEGLWTDRPEVNFLTATFNSGEGQTDPIRMAARTSRCFLGLRIDCLQCHNDFLGNVSLGDVDEPREGLQTDFHQLAAFYTSAKTNGLQGIREGDVDYQYKYLDATEDVAVEPAVPYSPELLPSDGKPRSRLAAWITHPKNKQAARAAVSHVWALMYGRPATDSVDNLPLDENFSPLLDAMADDFIENGFDMRRLIRLITRSSAFRVDSRADFDVTSDHEDKHAVFPLVRLRPEQVAGTMIQASRIKKIDRNSSFFIQLQKFGGTNDFVTRYGDMGEDEFTTESVTITQRLVMLNGSMVKETVGSNPILNTAGHVNLFAADNPSAVETIYLCTLNRYPSETEHGHFLARLDEAKNRAEAIEDLTWVLFNSTEFAWNH